MSAPQQAYRVAPEAFAAPYRRGRQRVFRLESRPEDDALDLNHPAVARFLASAPPTFSRADAIDELGQGSDPDAASEAFDALISAGALLPAGTRRDADDWLECGWDEAAVYHFGTRDFPFVQMGNDYWIADQSLMDQYSATAPSPPKALYAPFDSTSHTQENTRGSEELVAMLSGTDTVERVTAVIYLCSASLRLLDFTPQGTFFSKSIPSGGARHVVDVFFVPTSDCWAHYAEELLYFHPLTHGFVHTLRRLPLTTAVDATYDLINRVPRDDSVLGTFIWTVSLARSMWRYRESRSFRAPVIDVGHVLCAYRTWAAEAGMSVTVDVKFCDQAFNAVVAEDPNIQIYPVAIGFLSAHR